MKLNGSNTKEMRVNFSSSSPSYPPIVINNQTVNIVTHAKLLDVAISNDLKWNVRVNAICKKASERLYALRLLKRNALPDKVYRACVRAILEHTCEARYNNLNVCLRNQIEQIHWLLRYSNRAGLNLTYNPAYNFCLTFHQSMMYMSSYLSKLTYVHYLSIFQVCQPCCLFLSNQCFVHDWEHFDNNQVDYRWPITVQITLQS